MYLKTYPGHFTRESIRSNVESFISDRWSASEEGEDLFIERIGLDLTFLVRQRYSMGKYSLPFVSGVLVKIYPDRAVTHLRFNHTLYVFLFFVGLTVFLFLKGRAKPQDLAFAAVAGVFFYYYVTGKVQSDIDTIFLTN
jgi:hypothetical protein